MNLTKPQKLIYDMEKFAGGSIAVICGSMLTDGKRDENELRRAVNEIYQLNDALRIRVDENVDGVSQSIAPYIEKEIEILRFADKAELDNYAEEYAKESVNLYGDLCEIKIVLLPEQYGLLVKLHHIIGDAWTLSLIGNQFNAILNGDVPEAYSYTDYVESEKEYIGSRRYEKDKSFFLEQFQKCDEVTYLSEKQNDTFSAKRKTFVIGKDEAKKITDYAATHETSAFMLFTAALATYMNRVKMNTEKFYIGTAVLNRATAKEKNTAGMFINTVPMLIELENEKSFAENLSGIEDTAFSVFRHQKYNYGDVLSDLRSQFGFGEKLYDVMISYQNASIGGGNDSTWYHCGMQTESLQIHIDDRDNEGVFRIHYDYLTDKFTEHGIEMLHAHLLNLLFSVIRDDSKKLYELELLTADEKQKLLFDFNDTAVDYPRDKCIHTLFEEQVEKTPDKIAVIACDKTLTYAELNEEANRIAHSLIKKGVGVGDIVAFALARKSYLISTIFGILKSGAAYLPIDPDYPQDRIEYILKDSNAKLFVSESNIVELLNNGISKNPNVAMSSDSLCYCIYTSGSTGLPKGAFIRHRNLVNFCNNNKANNLQSFIVDKCKTVLACGSITFDISNFEIVLSLLQNKTVCFANETEINSAVLLGDLVLKQNVDCIHITPTKLQAFLDDDVFSNAFKAIKCVMVGGEVLTEQTVDCIRKYSNAKVFNGYGPTETTMGVGFGDIEGLEITIGKPIANTQIYIVDPYMNITPIGVTGELCIAGDGVGAGYLNRPELTAEKFIDNPFGEGKLYKTGDLAYWREDGNIVYVGRNDFQVKIRGLRIELGEIENAISSVDGISQSVVIVRKNNEGRQLICAFYTGKEIEPKEIRAQIGKKLPKYMLPHIFTHLSEMPLTTSGKINRKALPEVDLYAVDTTVEYIAPQTEKEIALVSEIKAVLKIEKVGTADNFFDLGGDSLKAIELISKLEKAGYHTDTKTIFACDTVKELAEQLQKAEEQAEEDFEYPADIPATPAQMRVYTAQNMNADSTMYNVPYVFKAKTVETDKLQKAINALVDRHEILRTTFENKDGTIIQVVDEKAVCKVEQLASDDILAFVRPFDLSKAPLLRVGVYENTVMIDMHHIITDGGSMPVFLRELNELYMGRTLESIPVPYKRFAVAPQDHTESEKYWLDVYKDELPELTINTDFKRGQKQSFNGSAVYDTVDIDLHNQIQEYCKKQNITPYVFYMAAFNILLSKFSGCEDIVVGMPISGRDGKFLDTIGMFVNTIALRNKPTGTKTVEEFLQEVKENSIAAIDHQDYPFGDLVKKLGLNTTDRNPLFDVMFAYQSEQMTEVIFEDEKAELLPIPVTTSKYDFTFNILPREDIVVIMAEYCTDLYKEQTVQRFIGGFKHLLLQMLNGKEIKDLSEILPDEQKKLLFDFNDTAVDYPRDKCVHTLFEEQVEKTPDKVALKFGDQSFTYAELNALANGLAKILQNKGIEHGDIVAIISKRSYHIVVAMLAVFKCGAAYLPIDYNYPKDRINTIVNDSGCKAVLTYDVKYDSEKTIPVPEHIKSITKNPKSESTPEDICGIIYTSGSTGTPKGTLLQHKGLVNYTFANDALYSGCTCVLGFAIYTFDAFFLDTISPMLRGVTAVMATESEQFNQLEFERLIKDNPGCNFFITPAKFKQFMDNRIDSLFFKDINHICIGGEIFPQEFIGLFDKHTKVFNVYGPTECSMWMMECPLINEDITIGKPIANTQIYIVDPYMNITPIGVTGELCIAGDGVGAGYLNRPELTAEKFIDNPFGEGKLYKTGDLAYWREDGNIVYVGRNDFQVKIRGLRIELGEIENAISSVDGISQSVVIVRKNNEGRQLICAFYTGKEVEPKEIRAQIGKKLPKYMLPHIFTRLSEMPLTTSGKINRKALPEVDLYAVDTTVEYIAPQTKQEKVLASAIESVLKIEKVGTADNFFDLGGDSLKAIELISKLEKAVYHTDTKTIFACDTVKELAEKLQKAEEQAEEDFEYPAEIPATPAQMRVYTAQSMNADSTTYNVPYVFKAKKVDIEKLQKAINALLDRHEILRTCFENKDGTIIQVVDENAVCKVEPLASDDILAFVRPFDLSQAPLIRVGVYENTVMIDMHHIITDGGSMPVFLRELNELYMGRTLDTTPVPYKRFAVAPQDHTESEKYWLEVYKDELPELTINTDFKRGQKQSFNGSAVYDTVDIDLHNQIQEYCKKQNITPYVFYMAAFNILLSKFSGCEDIVVGMPISGRDGKFLDTIGMFVNTIALRNKPTGTKTVEEFLQEVKENSIAAIDHQDYPFGDLVKKLGLNTADRNPLFDVMFAYQSEQMTDVIFGDEKAELLQLPVTTSKYDFTFNILPREDNVVIMAEYCTDLYKEQTIQRFIGGFRQILTQMLSGGEPKSISAVLPEEKQKLLFDFNDTAMDYPRDKCVHQLFEEQAAKTPDKVAVIACDKTLTYRELNEEANRIAHALIELGVQIGDIVALKLLRRSYLFSALFGILKAGAAYIPIDPDYPQDRIDYMIIDSKAKYCITEDNIEELLNNTNQFNPNVEFESASICYCIYTSGSTGTPKGTLLTHKNVVNFCSINTHNAVASALKNYKRIVSITTIGFDIFVTESILPLVSGLEVVLANEKQSKLPSELNALLRITPVDVIQTTPTKMRILMSEPTQNTYLKRIQMIILGGEALESLLVEQLCHYSDAEIYNIYGPTETTVWVTNALIRRKRNTDISKNALCLKSISAVCESEKKLLLQDFNDTAVNYPRDKCVHTLFEEQVEKTPDKVAVIACDKTLTYAELNEEANKIAHSLIAKGVGVGDIVAFALPRKSYLISTIFGILKSGVAYLPIDPDYPQDRIDYMLSESKARYFIDKNNIEDLLSNGNVSNPTVDVSGNDLFCALHTSGSTGTPKMSLLKHSSMMNFITANKRFWAGVDTVVSATIVTFDAFQMDSVLSISQGYKLVLANEDEIYNQAQFEELFSYSEKNMFFSTPTKIENYIDSSKDRQYLSRIQSFVIGGEVFNEALLDKIVKYSPESKVFNIYGPTETTICTVVDELGQGKEITIGKPIANTQIYIVDPYMNPTPIGVTGELCIAGDGVGAGYLNRPELTAEKFVDNPFGAGKLYKTGDLAYWREDGNIVYVGRNDFQVKIRGLRIELGEIENAISAIEGISQSVVVVRKNNEGRQLICAFYTGKEVEPKEIRAHIGKKLPKYMLPHIFTHLDEMPLTTSGKINRKALPEVDLYNITNDAEFVAPTTERQKELCRLMEEVLKTSPIGITDDFFDLGGDSLKAIEFVSKAHNEGIYFNLQNIFDYPTVSALCDCIENGDKSTVSFADVDFSAVNALLAKNTVEQMTVPQKTEVDNILLAGATGYLGIHILADYLENDSGIAYCIVRGKDQTDSEKRLADLMQFYFGDHYANTDRIKVICADLQKDKFGLSEEEYADLLGKINTVINCAASVKHYGSYKYFYEANVETTKRLIEFSKAANAKLIHTSTLSVSGNTFGDDFDGYISQEELHFYESSLYIGQPLDNVYARSKFEAEKAVLDAMTDGLQANIMRMGNLTNRYSDGMFQKNYESNAAAKRIKSVLELGVVPDYLMDIYCEFTPIDEAANAVMTIARHFSTEQTVFHINSIKVVYLDKLVEYFNKLGYDMKVVDGKTFTEALRQTAKQSGMEHIFETFINDMDENDKLQYDSNIRIENDFTVQYLKQLGFEWKEIDLEYLRRYVQYFRKIGYMK